MTHVGQRVAAPAVVELLGSVLLRRLVLLVLLLVVDELVQRYGGGVLS